MADLSNRVGPLDAWVLAGHEENSGSTHPHANCRIDHCFVSGNIADRVSTATIDENAKGSDHYPVEVTFS